MTCGLAVDLMPVIAVMCDMKWSQFPQENKKFFELKNEGYRDGIKRKETR